jgi:hypothetical protein
VHSQNQGSLLSLMTNKAILCYICVWSHDSFHDSIIHRWSNPWENWLFHLVVPSMGMQTPSVPSVLSLATPLGTLCSVQWLAESIHLCICQSLVAEMCVCVCIHRYMYTCVNTYIHICVYICPCAYIYIFIHIYLCICIHTCIYINTHTHTHIYIHTHTDTHTYVHAQTDTLHTHISEQNNYYKIH